MANHTITEAAFPRQVAARSLDQRNVDYGLAEQLLGLRKRDRIYFAGGCDHLPTVVYTRRFRDCFRKRFWVRCWRWNCDLKLGPYDRPEAHVFELRILRSAS